MSVNQTSAMLNKWHSQQAAVHCSPQSNPARVCLYAVMMMGSLLRVLPPHVDNPVALSLMPYCCGQHWLSEEFAFLCLQLWALGQSGELQLLNMFAQTASPVQSITLHPSKQSILMAVTDGTISLWQLDTLGELYRYKHEGRVEGLSFTDTDDFYFFSGPQVWHEHYCNLTGTPCTNSCSKACSLLLSPCFHHLRA